MASTAANDCHCGIKQKQLCGWSDGKTLNTCEVTLSQKLKWFNCISCACSDEVLEMMIDLENDLEKNLFAGT